MGCDEVHETLLEAPPLCYPIPTEEGRAQTEVRGQEVGEIVEHQDLTRMQGKKAVETIPKVETDDEKGCEVHQAKKEDGAVDDLN